MKLKQILAGVLTAAMVVTSVPVAGLGGIVASAADETESTVAEKVLKEIDTWTLRENAFADSEKIPTVGSDGGAAWAFDNEYERWWHTAYDVPKNEFRIGSSFGRNIRLKKVTYRPRTNQVQGWIEGYELWVTYDGCAAAEGKTTETYGDKVYEKVANGTFQYTDAEKNGCPVKEIELSEAVNATGFYLKAVGDGIQNVNASRIRVFEEADAEEYGLLTGLTGTADSEEPRETINKVKAGTANYALDGDPGTHWHSQWDSDKGGSNVSFADDQNNNYYIKLKEASTVKAVTYLPREHYYDGTADSPATNGSMKDFEVYYTTEKAENASDVQNWTLGGEKTHEYVLRNVEGADKTNFTEQEVVINDGTEGSYPKGVTYIKIRVKDAMKPEGPDFINAAEFGVIGKVDSTEEPQPSDERTALAAPVLSVTMNDNGDAEVTGSDNTITRLDDTKGAVIAPVAGGSEITYETKGETSGFSGDFTVAKEADELDVAGTDPFLFSFKLWLNALPSGDKNIVTKTAATGECQYTIVAKPDAINAYMNIAGNIGGEQWPQDGVPINSEALGKWLNVVVIYQDATNMWKVIVDDTESSKTDPDRHHKGTGAVPEADTANPSMRFFNDFPGKIADFKMYKGNASITTAVKNAGTAEAVAAALAEANAEPVLDLAARAFDKDYSITTTTESATDGSKTVTATLEVVDKENKKFTEDSIPEAITVDDKEVTDFTATVSNDGNQMTVVYTVDTEVPTPVTTTRRYGDGGTEIPEDGNVLTDADQAFYDGMKAFTATVVFKMPDLTKDKEYALLSLGDKQNNYITLWYKPYARINSGTYQGQISVLAHGEDAYFSDNASYLSTTETGYHKATISLIPDDQGQLTMITALDDKNHLTYKGTWSGQAADKGLNGNHWFFKTEAWLKDHAWNVEEVLVGKKPTLAEGVTFEHAAMEALDLSSIKYVEVSEETFTSEMVTAKQAEVLASLKTEFTDLKTECAALNENDYTTESWSGMSAANTAAAAVDAETAKEWTLYTQIEALTNAKNALKRPIDAATLSLAAPATGAASASATTEDTNYTVTTTWKEGETALAEGAVFAPETVYTAEIVLTPAEGYAFATDAPVTLNGAEVTPTKNPDGTLTISKTFDETAPIEITSVNVKVTAPANGMEPQKTIADDDKYTGTITWKAGDEAFTEETFGADTAYTAVVTLAAKTGYVFTQNAEVKINNVVDEDATVTHTDDKTLVITKTFAATSHETAIAKPNLSLTAPAIGVAPAQAVSKDVAEEGGLKDIAEAPAAVTQSTAEGAAQIAQAEGNGFTGDFTVGDYTAEGYKLNLEGSEPFVFSFDVKIPDTIDKEYILFTQTSTRIGSDGSNTPQYTVNVKPGDNVALGQGVCAFGNSEDVATKLDRWPQATVGFNALGEKDNGWVSVAFVYTGKNADGEIDQTSKFHMFAGSGHGEDRYNNFAIAAAAGNLTFKNELPIKNFKLYKGDNAAAAANVARGENPTLGAVTAALTGDPALNLSYVEAKDNGYTMADDATAWTKSVEGTDTALAADETFTLADSYKATITLQPKDGWEFAAASKPESIEIDGKEVVLEDSDVTVDAQGNMVITVSFPAIKEAKDALHEAVMTAPAKNVGEDGKRIYSIASWNAYVAVYNAAADLLSLDDQTGKKAEDFSKAKAALEEAIAKLEPASEEEEETITITPDVTVAKPVVGEKPVDAKLTEAVLDTNAIFTYGEDFKVNEDGSFSGTLTASNSEKENQVFDAKDTTKLLMNFKLKTAKPTKKETIIGKLNKQYGVQLTVEGGVKLIMFGKLTGGWAEVDYTIPSDAWYDSEHEVVAIYNGNGFEMYVDGVAATDVRPAVKGKLQSDPESIFTIGYNAGKEDSPDENGNYYCTGQEFSGTLKDVKMYIGENMPTYTIEAEDKAADIMKKFTDAMAEKDTDFDLSASKLNPQTQYQINTKWTCEETEMGAEAVFEQYKDYKVEVVLTAKEGYKFSANANATLRTEERILDDADVVVSGDGKTMTITYTFKGEEHPKVTLENYLASEAVTNVGTLNDKNERVNLDEDGHRMYTVASWDAFADKLNAANAALADETTTPEQYTEKLNDLKAAVEALKLAKDNCECTLGNITGFENITENLETGAELTITLGGAVESYSTDCMKGEHAGATPSLAYAFDGTYDGAELADGVLTVTKAGIYKVKLTVTLGDVTKNETITVTVTSRANEEEWQALQDAITNAEKYDKDQYTADSWAKVEKALKEAKEIKQNNATAAEVNSAKDALQEAIAGLKLQADADKEALFDTLGRLIDDATAKKESGLYTVESANALAAVCNEAVKTYNKAIDENNFVHLENVTADELDKAIKDLQAAIDKLVTKEAQAAADLKDAQTTVTTALSDAKKLVDAGQGSYSDATWKAFTDAYAAAQAAAASKDPVAIKKAAAALAAAQKALAQGAAAPAVKAGQKIEMKDGRYQIISVEKKTVRLVKAKAKKTAKMGVAGSISINGVKYTVVEVGAKAFKGIKTLKQITLSKNIKTIGKQAFAGCKKLSKVVVKSTVLKTIKSGAFKGTSKKMTVTFKSKKVKAKTRKALLKKMKKAGMSKSAKLK